MLRAYPDGDYAIYVNDGGVYLNIAEGASSELSDLDPLGGIYEAERAAEAALERDYHTAAKDDDAEDDEDNDTEDGKADSFAMDPRAPAPAESQEDDAKCPLCGSDSFDGEFCPTCGYRTPPEGLGDIKMDDEDEVKDEEDDDDEKE